MPRVPQLKGDRVTEKDAKRCLVDFAQVVGRKVSTEPGGLTLDCNPFYGDCMIQLVESPGARTPVSRRMSPRALCEAVRMVEAAERIRRR